MRGHVDHRVRPNLSRNKTANWVLASATKSEMVSNRAHRKRRNARPVTLSPAPFERPLRFYTPDGMNRHDGWLAVESRGYADFGEAEASGALLQEGLLIVAAKQKVGVELYLRGAVKAIHVYPEGQFELRDPGLPLPTP